MADLKLVAARVTETEKHRIGIAAALEGVTVNDFIRLALLPAVEDRLKKAGPDPFGQTA